eukprot:scaffold8708_cov30-Tisochrysis_lutea.AAC.1
MEKDAIQLMLTSTLLLMGYDNPLEEEHLLEIRSALNDITGTTFLKVHQIIWTMQNSPDLGKTDCSMVKEQGREVSQSAIGDRYTPPATGSPEH